MRNRENCTLITYFYICISFYSLLFEFYTHDVSKLTVQQFNDITQATEKFFKQLQVPETIYTFSPKSNKLQPFYHSLSFVKINLLLLIIIVCRQIVYLVISYILYVQNQFQCFNIKRKWQFFKCYTTTVAFKYNSRAHRKMKYSLIPPPLPFELNIYIINGIRIATTQSHKSLAKLPSAIVNPN